MDKEKVYISSDEDSKMIWVWRKPSKGNWSPTKVKGCGMVNWQREDRSLENTDHYLAKDFKKKFGININAKTKRCCHLPIKLLNNEDYKLSSNNPDRKK